MWISFLIEQRKSNTFINKSFTFSSVLLVFKLMSNLTTVSYKFRINIPVLHIRTKDFKRLCLIYSVHL